MRDWWERLHARLFRGHCPYCGRGIPFYVLQDRKWRQAAINSWLEGRLFPVQPVLSRWHCLCGRLSLDMWVTAIMGDTGRLPDTPLSPNPPDPKPNPGILVPLMDGEKRKGGEGV